MKDNEQPVPKRRRFGRAAWICLAIAWVLATAGGYLFLDPIVSRRLWDHPSTWHTNLWVDGFRQLGRGGMPIWLVSLWSCLTDKWRPTVVTMAAMILVGASVCPLKALVHRARPRQVFPAASGQSVSEVPWQKKSSFPSGDAAVAFAGATALSLSWGRFWTPVFFVAATAIGVLRVTAFAHYPSDVMAGALIGVWCGVMATQWTPHRWAPNQFRIAGRWRLAVALALILVLPFLGPYIGMSSSLQVFLRVYKVPLLVLILACLAVIWWRMRKPEPQKTETQVQADR